MRAIILAAGYATRMYPLTLTRAKPLLPVGGRPVVEHLIDNLAAGGRVHEAVLVSNHRFAADFERWASSLAGGVRVRVLDDGSTSEADRLGAVGDLHFAVSTLALDEALLVVAGDNLLPFPLAGLVELHDRTGSDVIAAYHQPDLRRLRRTGVATLGPHGRVLAFEEKPSRPPTQWAVPPVYVLSRGSVAAVGRYLAEGNDADAPGHLVAWLCARAPVHAFIFCEPPLDIGDLDSFRRADRLLSAADPPGQGGPRC